MSEASDVRDSLSDDMVITRQFLTSVHEQGSGVTVAALAVALSQLESELRDLEARVTNDKS